MGSPGPGRRMSAVSEKLLTPKTMVGLLIAVLSIWFIVANSGEIRVHLWVFWVSARLWLVLLGTFIAGLATGWLLKRHRTPR